MARIKKIDKITFHYLTETVDHSGERCFTNPCINVFCGNKVIMINPFWSDVTIMPRRIYDTSSYKNGIEIKSLSGIPSMMYGASTNKAVY